VAPGRVLSGLRLWAAYWHRTTRLVDIYVTLCCVSSLVIAWSLGMLALALFAFWWGKEQWGICLFVGYGTVSSSCVGRLPFCASGLLLQLHQCLPILAFVYADIDSSRCCADVVMLYSCHCV
jgi:hypothetical protein